VKAAPSVISTSRWGPYVVAGVLLLADYLWLSRGLTHPGPGYGPWALSRGIYDDVIKLTFDHYVRPGHFIHPVPYLDDRIEYPVLLGFTLWLPTWLPGGPASWFAATGVLTAAATFGSIALIRRQHPASVWWIAASPALLLDGAINWDLIGIVFLVGGVVWFGEHRYGLSGASTAVGTFFKLFPVVVAPMALSALGSRWWHSISRSDRPTGEGRDPGVDGDVNVPGPGRNLVRWLVPFTVISVVVAVPFLVLAPSNTLWFVRFNSIRPQKDSIWEVKFLADSAVGNHIINTASLLVVVAAMAYGAWMVWRTPVHHQARAVSLATAMVVIVWMAVNKIWNPQYVLWVFAVGALAAIPARFGVALGALSVYDFTFEFVIRRPDVHASYAWVGWLSVLARTVLFVLMAKWAVDELRRQLIPVRSPSEGTRAHAAS
jgi:hypothetical protein